MPCGMFCSRSHHHLIIRQKTTNLENCILKSTKLKCVKLLRLNDWLFKQYLSKCSLIHITFTLQGCISSHGRFCSWCCYCHHAMHRFGQSPEFWHWGWPLYDYLWSVSSIIADDNQFIQVDFKYMGFTNLLSCWIICCGMSQLCFNHLLSDHIHNILKWFSILL